MFVYNGFPYLAHMAINATPYENRSQADIVMSVEVPGALSEISVQSVNGQTGDVKLSAADVGARPDDWMPTAQEVGALPSTYTPPNQTAEQVGADPRGAAASAVSQHNTADDSHNDIRLELKAINDRLTAFFDSDNQTLDELSEIVAYITSNKSLIDAITTSKVGVTDIIDNLTTNVSNKPLSAAQGVVLKGLIDTLSGNLANYQPKGDYALRSELPAVPVKSVNGKTGDVSLTAADVKARPENWMPTASDVGALPSSELPAAINTALAQAKASGEFDGKDGKTPVKGVDFWTAADQESMVQDVIAALGTPVFGRVDADNNIILTGELVDGTYTLKYEDADGNTIEIGTLDFGVSPDVALNLKLGKLDKSTGAISGLGTDKTYLHSDLIEIVDGYNYSLTSKGGNKLAVSICYWDANSSYLSSAYSNNLFANVTVDTTESIPLPSEAKYFRTRCYNEDYNWNGMNTDSSKIPAYLEYINTMLLCTRAKA
jgi:hypothetical protein